MHLSRKPEAGGTNYRTFFGSTNLSHIRWSHCLSDKFGWQETWYMQFASLSQIFSDTRLGLKGYAARDRPRNQNGLPFFSIPWATSTSGSGRVIWNTILKYDWLCFFFFNLHTLSRVASGSDLKRNKYTQNDKNTSSWRRKSTHNVNLWIRCKALHSMLWIADCESESTAG